MKVYIGYILSDYTTACWMSLDKNALKKKIKEYEELPGRTPTTWTIEYDLHKAEVVDLDGDGKEV